MLLRREPFKMTWDEIANSTDTQILLDILQQHRISKINEALAKNQEHKPYIPEELRKQMPFVGASGVSDEVLESWSIEKQRAHFENFVYRFLRIPKNKDSEKIVEEIWQDGQRKKAERNAAKQHEQEAKKEGS